MTSTNKQRVVVKLEADVDVEHAKGALARLPRVKVLDAYQSRRKIWRVLVELENGDAMARRSILALEGVERVDDEVEYSPTGVPLEVALTTTDTNDLYHRDQVSIGMMEGAEQEAVRYAITCVPGVESVARISVKLGLYMATIDEVQADTVLKTIREVQGVKDADFPAKRHIT